MTFCIYQNVELSVSLDSLIRNSSSLGTMSRTLLLLAEEVISIDGAGKTIVSLGETIGVKLGEEEESLEKVSPAH